MRPRYSGYLAPIYKSSLKYRRLIARIAGDLRKLKRKTKFQAIAFRGTSGAALAFPLSAELNVSLICTRKVEEKSHGRKVEGPNKDIERYIIIDDFIDTGKTIKAIIDAIEDENSYVRGRGKDRPAKCVGIVLYDQPAKDEDWIADTVFKYRREKIPIHNLGKL